MLPGVIVAPHFNRQSGDRLRGLLDSVPGSHVVVGVDEHTAAVSCPDSDEWEVMGRGIVAVMHGNDHPRYHHGQRFRIPHVHVGS
mgnify:CR=1 FL=1